MAEVTKRRKPVAKDGGAQTAVAAKRTVDTLAPMAQPPCADGSASPAERAALGLWLDLARVAGTVRSRLTAALAAACGLAPEEVALLVQLSEAPERRLRMADVGHILMLSRSGVTRMVDRLVARGLVARRASPSDRRAVYASLTDDGRRVLSEAAPLLRTGVVEHLGRHLSARELGATRGALRKIIDAEDVGS